MAVSAPPDDDALIADLLLHWQDARDRGAACGPDDLCRDRPDLLDRVRDRVRALDAMHGLLGLDPVPDALAQTRPSSASAPPPDIAGYEDLVLVGEGGVGAVYRARHVRLRRPVAIKMLRAGRHARADQVARFRGEAEAVARLRHPNVVQIYEVGECQGQPYFVMEYVAEGNLAQRLARGLIPPREAAELVRTLAEAMQHAHACGVVHRDLKPANILLRKKPTPAGDSFDPLVGDFGLAKLLDEEGATHTGTVLGTPQYLAPEQAAGNGRDVGPATDVHALGAILYEMLAGRPPYLGESTFEIMEQIRATDPVPPSRAQPRTPAELEVICLKCLAKDPGDRYPTAAALGDDLGRYLRGESIRARRTPAWRRAARWARREPWVAGSATLAVAAVVTLLAIWVSFTQQLRTAATRLQIERDEAGRLQVQAEEGQRAAEAEKKRAEYLLVRCMSAIDEHARATEQSREMKVRTGDPGSIPYVVARVYAASAKVYTADPDLGPLDRQRFGERYAAKAVELLNRAAEHGYFESEKNRSKLLTDPDLAVLRDRADFAALVKTLGLPAPARKVP